MYLTAATTFLVSDLSQEVRVASGTWGRRLLLVGSVMCQDSTHGCWMPLDCLCWWMQSRRPRLRLLTSTAAAADSADDDDDDDDGGGGGDGGGAISCWIRSTWSFQGKGVA